MSYWIISTNCGIQPDRYMPCVDGTEQEYQPTRFRDQGKNMTLNTKQQIFPICYQSSLHFLTKTDSTGSSQTHCLILESNPADRSAPLSSAKSCFRMEYFRRSLVTLLFFPQELPKIIACYARSVKTTETQHLLAAAASKIKKAQQCSLLCERTHFTCLGQKTMLLSKGKNPASQLVCLSPV